MIKVASGTSPLDTPLLDAAPGCDNDAQGRTLYIAFLVLGVGSVLPTFVLGAAIDYFASVSPGNDLVFELNAWFNGMLFVLSIVNALWLTRFGFTARIVWGFVTMGVCFATLPMVSANESIPHCVGSTCAQESHRAPYPRNPVRATAGATCHLWLTCGSPVAHLWLTCGSPAAPVHTAGSDDVVGS